MVGHMRTTVRLDDALLERAKKVARERGVTLTSLLDQGLRLVLASGTGQAQPTPVELPICTAGGGVLPGVDLDDSVSVLDLLEKHS